MGILDKLKGAMRIDDDFEEEEEIREAAYNQQARRAGEGYAPPRNSGDPNKKQHSFATYGKGSNSLKLMIIEPSGFDECSKYVDLLKTRKPVILNLEKLDIDMARKIFDFMSGATYALNGKVQPVTDDILVFAPENVGVTIEGDKKSDEPEFDFNNKKGWR